MTDSSTRLELEFISVEQMPGFSSSPDIRARIRDYKQLDKNHNPVEFFLDELDCVELIRKADEHLQNKHSLDKEKISSHKLTYETALQSIKEYKGKFNIKIDALELKY